MRLLILILSIKLYHVNMNSMKNHEGALSPNRLMGVRA